MGGLPSRGGGRPDEGECARTLESALGVSASAVSSPRETVEDADVVITTTTSTEPVFPGDALATGALVVAVGAYTAEMRELDERTVERATRVFADVPEEARETGDLRDHDDLEVVPFGDVLVGRTDRPSSEEVLVLESVGSAVLDAAAATFVFERAEERGLGESQSL